MLNWAFKDTRNPTVVHNKTFNTKNRPKAGFLYYLKTELRITNFKLKLTKFDEGRGVVVKIL